MSTTFESLVMVDGREATGRRTPDLFGKLLSKAQAEADWLFSWGLEPPPKGTEVPQGVVTPPASAP